MIRFYIFLIATFSFDRLIKFWIEQNFDYLNIVVLKNPIFDIMYVKNKGIAFSLLENNFILIKILTLAFLIFSIFYIFKNKTNLSLSAITAWGILLGGVIGNFYDRLVYNYVIDYIKLKFVEFPIMNFADIAINLGIITLIVLVISDKELKNAK